MRITGGTLRGRRLPSPLSDRTRPTTDMWRSSIFDAIQHLASLDGAHVLDVFAGTGALGFEALSRGADHVTSIELFGRQAQQIRMTAQQLDLSEHCTVIHDDVRRWLHERKAEPQWDIVFADPPYDLRIGTRLLQLLDTTGVLTTSALVVLEHSPDECVECPERWTHVWSKDKGDTAVDMYRYDHPVP